MEKTFIDRYYNIVSHNNDNQRDKFDEIVDSIFELHNNKKISEQEMRFLFKFALYYELKKEIEKEKKLFVRNIGKRSNKNTDTLSINVISKEFSYDK